MQYLSEYSYNFCQIQVVCTCFEGKEIVMREKDDISGFDQHRKTAETAVVVSHIGGWDK